MLVSACHTDLGDAGEAAAGYYNRPWDWQQIRRNAGWMVQFHSRDDPLVPVGEGLEVASGLGLDLSGDLHLFDDKGHLWHYFPELVEMITRKLDPEHFNQQFG